MSGAERWDALSAWASMGIAARVILVVLAAFAALLFFIVVERFVAYRRAERPAAPPPATLALQLRRHLHALAAIKVTAPMLGLLGTLLGLINGFAGMALSGVVDTRALAAGDRRGAPHDRAGPRDRPARVVGPQLLHGLGRADHRPSRGAGALAARRVRPGVWALCDARRA